MNIQARKINSARTATLALCAAVVVAFLAVMLTTATDASAQAYPAPSPELGVMRLDGISPYAPGQLALDGPFDVFVTNPAAFGVNCGPDGPWYATIGAAAIVDGSFVDLYQGNYFVNSVLDVPGWVEQMRTALNANADIIGVGDEVFYYWSTDGCDDGSVELSETVTVTGPLLVTSGPVAPIDSGTDVTAPVVVLAGLSAATAALFVARRRGVFNAA